LPACRSTFDRDVFKDVGSGHPSAAFLPPACNILPPISARRPVGACRRWIMEIVGVVMLGSVVLWFSQQFDRHEW
jgi:hypothetical protein